MKSNVIISKEEKLEPYTVEELNARIDRAENNYVEGRHSNSEEVHQEITDLLTSL